MKTILITGSTDGIGKLAAIQLAKSGHHIIVHGRSSEKLQKTISEVKALANNEKVNGFVSDLSDFSSVQKMVAELTQSYIAIDVLMNNAGVFKSGVQHNQDGFDMRFAVNYFAPYLLTHDLMSLLKKSPSPRVINLSSAAQSTVSLPALAGKEAISVQAAYAQSKLALTMWSFYLSQKFDFLNVIAVNPGSLLNTRMVQEAYGHSWAPADKGATILSELAIAEKFDNSTGKYFDNDIGAFGEAHIDAYNRELIAELIAATNEILDQ